jgi:hypothetical protein
MVFLVAMATTPSLAQSDLQLDLTQEVLEASGTRGALERLPALTRAQAQSDPRVAGLTPEERKRFEATFAAAFDPEAMYRTIVAETLERFHEEHFRDFLAAYRTPLAEHLVQLGLRVMEPQAWQAKEAYLKTVTPAQMEQPRAALLGELDVATLASAMEAEITLKALSGLVAQRQGETDEAFAARYEQLREKVYVNAHAKFIAAQLFVYESVSDADIESFVRLNQTEPVSYTSRAISVATLAAMLQSLDRLMSALTDQTAEHTR